MGWISQRENWKANLAYAKARPFAGLPQKSTYWDSGRQQVVWPEGQQELLEPDFNPAGRPSRICFPVKFGMGSGVGVGNFPDLTLRIVQVKFGAAISSWTGDACMKASRRKHGTEWGTLGNIVEAAGILLLSQAFFGPLVAFAMTCMASLEVASFAIRLFRKFKSNDYRLLERSNYLGWPARVHEFSAASVVLSISIPVLRYQQPALHHTLNCVGAAIPVAVGYARTAALVRGAPVGGSGLGEQLWRSRHRWAARRLYRYLSNFQEPSPLGWLLDIWQTMTIIWGARDSGYKKQYSVNIGNQLQIFGSMALPFKSLRDSSIQDDPHKELVISLDPVTKSPSESRLCVHGLSDTMSWETTAPEEMFDEFGIVHTGWRGLQQKISLVLRAFHLALVFLPLVLFGPIMYIISTIVNTTLARTLREWTWRLLRFCLEKGGAAFIKWGQWSATREDLFSPDLCKCLGRLHDRAPEHGYEETRIAIFESFGLSIEDLFDEFPKKPCASGSIAQVYKAKLRNAVEGIPVDVAVKVRHPSVALRIYQDFQIMGLVADWAQRLPSLHWLKLRESVDQFSHTMTTQADLRVEAQNLHRFNCNFEGLHQTVVFPKLVPSLVSEGVIVESFERGQALHEFLSSRSALNTQIAAVGVDTYLKMMLMDNFVHTDLHPGNILARDILTDSAGFPDEVSPALEDVNDVLIWSEQCGRKVKSWTGNQQSK